MGRNLQPDYSGTDHNNRDARNRDARNRDRSELLIDLSDEIENIMEDGVLAT